MRASTGAYYPRLDHIRALAAFLVFFWHVTHMSGTAYFAPDFFAFSLFDEGWTGVSSFMVLSGYLFTKIADGGEINYGAFLWNRFIRLAPLLLAVTAYYAIFHGYTWIEFVKGFYDRTWPSTAWSITVELHFYLVFPALLFFQRRVGTGWLLLSLVASIGLRAWLWRVDGEVHEFGYWTIVGHIDQFVLGMVLCRLSATAFFERFGTWIFLSALIGFMAFWHMVNLWGGFYALEGPYPSPSPLWIVLPTIEGVFWSTIIAGYDKAKFSIPSFIDKPLALIGSVSYSIYLIHRPILDHLLKPVMIFPTDFTAGALLSITLFVPVVLACWVSYELIEKPFLRFRVKYLNATKPKPAAA